MSHVVSESGSEAEITSIHRYIRDSEHRWRPPEGDVKFGQQFTFDHNQTNFKP